MRLCNSWPAHFSPCGWIAAATIAVPTTLSLAPILFFLRGRTRLHRIDPKNYPGMKTTFSINKDWFSSGLTARGLNYCPLPRTVYFPSQRQTRKSDFLFGKKYLEILLGYIPSFDIQIFAVIALIATVSFCFCLLNKKSSALKIKARLRSFSGTTVVGSVGVKM